MDDNYDNIMNDIMMNDIYANIMNQCNTHIFEYWNIRHQILNI